MSNQMRIQIGSRGVGGRDENWYYLEFNEEEGKFYHVHEYDYYKPVDDQNRGEKKVPLEQAKDKPYYDKAIEIIKERIFSESAK